MPNPVQLGRKDRMTFSKINEVAEMPNLYRFRRIHMIGLSEKASGSF